MADYGMTRNGSGCGDETPVQQDEVKGALPLSTIGHPTAQGRVLATAAQCRHCIRLVRLCLTSFLPEGFHPSGHPFCDQGGEHRKWRVCTWKYSERPDRSRRGSQPKRHTRWAENEPKVPGAENPSNVAPDGRIKGAKSPKPAKVVSA